ncbi:hypothetical protein FH972_024285 [Carpinus fangiana]|uniref:C2H2-type domain-containing protein n=1 Tax=Carpinus fangiana TaxID=176857 RepID=A0A5N6KXL9_9ROSI|nr:hypothetical protein FH972_024285 [Carpinus fangiana]
MSLEGPASADGSSRKADYSCSTCMVKFDDSKAQRAHMRDDRQYVDIMMSTTNKTINIKQHLQPEAPYRQVTSSK